MSKDLYDLFDTDPSLEAAGVRIYYGEDIYLDVARAGGNNKRFARRLEALMKPYRRNIQMDAMDEEVARGLLIQAFAETVVTGWGSKAQGDGKFPFRDKDSKETVYLDFTVDNVKKVFTRLPNLFDDVRAQSATISLFRSEEAEADAKN
jgi:hypothetical protein